MVAKKDVQKIPKFSKVRKEKLKNVKAERKKQHADKLSVKKKEKKDLDECEPGVVMMKPPSSTFKVFIDTQNQHLDKTLAEILFEHSFDIPLVINLVSAKSIDHNEISSHVYCLFHCSNCSDYWTTNQKILRNCNKVTQYKKGQEATLTMEEAIDLIDLLYWSDKFTSRDIMLALVDLKEARDHNERTRILKVLLKSAQNAGMASLDPGKRNTYKSNRTKSFGARMANSLRERIFPEYIQKSSSQITAGKEWVSQAEVIMDKISLVGMQSNDGCFYPGFFTLQALPKKRPTNRLIDKQSDSQNALSKRNSKGQDVFRALNEKQTPNNLDHRNFKVSEEKMRTSLENVDEDIAKEPQNSFNFVARGRIDDDGCYHSFDGEENQSYNDIEFPNLKQMINAQTNNGVDDKATNQLDRVPSNSEDPNILEQPSSKFTFSVQEGISLNLREVLSSGLWYNRGNDEYFFAGVFDIKGTFKASYCISNTGYLVPGTTNNARQFIPLSKYGEGGFPISVLDGKEISEEHLLVLRSLAGILNFPTANEVLKNESTTWAVVKNGTLTKDSASIAVLSDKAFDDTEHLNVFVGGNIGPDGYYYLGGKYQPNGSFLSGGPLLITDKILNKLDCNTPNDSLSKNFFQQFGIRLESANLTNSHHKKFGGSPRVPQTSSASSDESSQDQPAFDAKHNKEIGKKGRPPDAYKARTITAGRRGFPNLRMVKKAMNAFEMQLLVTKTDIFSPRPNDLADEEMHYNSESDDALLYKNYVHSLPNMKRTSIMIPTATYTNENIVRGVETPSQTLDGTGRPPDYIPPSREVINDSEDLKVNSTQLLAAKKETIKSNQVHITEKPSLQIPSSKQRRKTTPKLVHALTINALNQHKLMEENKDAVLETLGTHKVSYGRQRKASIKLKTLASIMNSVKLGAAAFPPNEQNPSDEEEQISSLENTTSSVSLPKIKKTTSKHPNNLRPSFPEAKDVLNSKPLRLPKLKSSDFSEMKLPSLYHLGGSHQKLQPGINGVKNGACTKENERVDSATEKKTQLTVPRFQVTDPRTLKQPSLPPGFKRGRKSGLTGFTLRRTILPPIDRGSSTNVSENFRLSYFDLPRYLTDYNNKPFKRNTRNLSKASDDVGASGESGKVKPPSSPSYD